MLNETQRNGALPKARSGVFGNTAEKPFSPPAVSSDLFREKAGPPLPRAPAPSESSYFRAQLFLPAMRTLALLAWPCRADTSLLWKSVEGDASKVYHQQGRRGWRAALASSGGSSDLGGGTGRGWTGCRGAASGRGNRLDFSLHGGGSQVPGSRWAAQPFAPGSWS